MEKSHVQLALNLFLADSRYLPEDRISSTHSTTTVRRSKCNLFQTRLSIYLFHFQTPSIRKYAPLKIKPILPSLVVCQVISKLSTFPFQIFNRKTYEEKWETYKKEEQDPQLFASRRNHRARLSLKIFLTFSNEFHCGLR